MTDASRPQDAGRSHKRRGAPSPETAALLTRYQAAMRDDLAALLEDLAPKVPHGLLADAPAERPNLADRTRLWDLAIKLGKELGSAIDADPVSLEPAIPRPRARGRVDYG